MIFCDRPSAQGGRADQRDGERHDQQLAETVCRLIQRGHGGAWRYGWGFFLIALRAGENR